MQAGSIWKRFRPELRYWLDRAKLKCHRRVYRKWRRLAYDCPDHTARGGADGSVQSRVVAVTIVAMLLVRWPSTRKPTAK